MKERVSIRPPAAFPQRTPVGAEWQSKARHGMEEDVASQATHHLSSVVNSIATIWRHNCHRGRGRKPPTAGANTDARADGNIMVTRVRGREGRRVLHNNELGSPEFRVAIIRCLVEDNHEERKETDPLT